MASTTNDFGVSSTAYSAADSADQWADLDHPLFYYDPGFKSFLSQKLAEVEALPPGWDSEGAPLVDRAIIRAVGAFVASLPRHIAARPMVVPLSSGGIQLHG